MENPKFSMSVKYIAFFQVLGCLLDKHTLYTYFVIYFVFFKCKKIFFFSVDTLIPATSFPLVSSVRGQLTLDGGNVRAIITQLLRRVQTKLLQHQSDDTRCFELLIQVRLVFS